MRLSSHVMIIGALVLPFEANHWLSADLVRINAAVIDSRIITPARPRVAPVVELDLRYVAQGAEYRTTLLWLKPADGRYAWRPEEQAKAEQFVRSHKAGSTVDIWVPRLVPSWGSALADGPAMPDSPPRNSFYIAYLSLLAVYLAGVIALKARKPRRPGA